MKKIKMALTVLALVASTWLAKSQSCPSNSCSVVGCEYVCNGGFNSYSSLPNALATTVTQQIQKVCGWSNAYGNRTPDYFHGAVTTFTDVDIPCNRMGSENYFLDDGYVGLWGVPGSWAEAIETTFINPLTMGDIYECSFVLSLADIMAGNIDNRFGIYFPSSGLSITINPSSSAVITNTAFGYTVTPSSVVSVTGWTQYKIRFTAANTENSLRIGFLSDPYLADYVAGSHSTYTNCTTAYTPDQSAYYYLDNVSMRQVLPISVVASNTTGCTGESFTLTASGVDTYTWSSPTSSTTSNPWVVTPTSTTIYTVTGTSSSGCVTTSTTVTISPALCCINTNSANNITLRNVTLMPSGTSTAVAIPWSSLSVGGFYTGNIAVPSGTTIISNTLTIVGGLTINTPVTFSLCNISITEDSPITQNYYTWFDRSWLFGCSNLWEGIVSNAELKVTNTFIEDAFIGINVGLWYRYSSHPGLTVDNSVFLKNWFGIAAGSCSMDPSSSTFKITGSVFMSRNVSSALHNFAVGTQYNSTLLPFTSRTPGKLLGSTAHSITAATVRSAIGIYVPSLTSSTGSPMFTIGGVGIDQTATDKLTNMFDYLNCGIYNTNSKLNIYNNKFGNMINLGVGNTAGAVYHDDGGSNAKNTITVIGGGGSPTAYYKNVFGFASSTSQVLDGVNAYHGGTLTVSHNDFNNITRYGVSVQDWAAPTPTDEPVYVANNTYTNSAYMFYGYNNQGITATVTANTMTGNTGTTYTNNSNIYIDDVGKSANSTFYINNNTLKTSLNGVYARNAQNVRVVDNTIEVNRPTSTSIFNSGVCFESVDNGFVKMNTISCNPTNASSFNTFGIFASASTNNKYKCNIITKVSACMKFQSNCSPSYNYNNSLNNTGGTDPCLHGIWLDNGAHTGSIGYWTGSAWEAANIFWGDFSSSDTKCQASSNYTPQATIYYNSASTPTADYRPLVNANTYFPSLPFDYSQSYLTATASALSENTCNETARFSNESGLSKGGSSLSNTDDGSTEPVLTKQMFLPIYQSNGSTNKVIKGVNEANFYVIDSLIQVYIATKNTGALNTAKNINTSIVASNNQEQNQKDLNVIYCVFVEDDSLVTGGQINYVQNLAMMCPFTEGLSVYQARGLMRTWDDSTFYYNPCENNIPEEYNNNSRFANSNENVNPDILIVYPNPTNGLVNVKTGAKDCTFELYDVIGKCVISRKLIDMETKIDVSSLNNGTYLYKITRNNVVIKADKLILNK